jgi:hypothetical protein
MFRGLEHDANFVVHAHGFAPNLVSAKIVDATERTKLQKTKNPVRL